MDSVEATSVKAKSPWRIAETIDWVNALEALNASRLDPETIEQTIGILLKHQDDIAQLEGLSAAKLIEEIHARGWLEDAH